MSTEPGRRRRPSWLVPVVIVAAAIVLIAAVVSQRDGRAPASDADVPVSAPSATPSATGTPRPTATKEEEAADEEDGLRSVERRHSEDPLTAGPADAPVALVVFSDYQCPFCAAWSEETLPVMKEYADAGRLRIEWRDINMYGPASDRAARASYAAALQGAFWEYHDALFADGEHRSETELTDEPLVSLAAELGLDPERFATDLAAQSTADAIAENALLGLGLGINVTPSFVLDGELIIGAQPTQVFVDAVDEALGDAAG